LCHQRSPLSRLSDGIMPRADQSAMQ
jgi:hypothetical protein